jgi:hypothetical protein
VEERATERCIVDAGESLWFVGEKEEGIPLVVGGGRGCGSHFGLLSGGVWVEYSFLVARCHIRECWLLDRLWCLCFFL